jgi:hypothetical protein
MLLKRSCLLALSVNADMPVAVVAANGLRRLTEAETS